MVEATASHARVRMVPARRITISACCVWEATEVPARYPYAMVYNVRPWLLLPSGVGPFVGVADGVDRGMNDLGKLITNADQGVALLWWEGDRGGPVQRLTMLS